MITYSTLERREDLEKYVWEAIDFPFVPVFLRSSDPCFRVYKTMSGIMGDAAGLVFIANDLEKKELEVDFYFVLDETITAPWEKVDYVAFFSYWLKRLDLRFVGQENKPIIMKNKPGMEYDYALDKFFDFSPLFFSYERKCLNDNETYKTEHAGRLSILEKMNDYVQIRGSSDGDKR